MRLQALILHGLKRSEQIELNHNTLIHGNYMLVHKPNAGKTLHLIMHTVFPNENKGLPNENNCTNLPESLMGIQRPPWKPRVCSSHMWDSNHHPKHRRRRCHGITPGAGKKVHHLEWSKPHQQICWWLKTLQQVEGWLVDYFHDL